MDDVAVYRPNLLASLLALGVLPLFTLAVFAGGIALITGAAVGYGVVLCALACLPGYLTVVMLFGWFSIRVDAEALSIVGLLGMWRSRMPWKEIKEIGTVPASLGAPSQMAELAHAATPVLAVRPVRPRTKAPWWALRWDEKHRLLIIAGLDKWTEPREVIIAGLRHHAGAIWKDDLTA